MSNIIGVRNNNTIVPYQAATKRTKWITVSASTDITLTGTGITTSSIATGAKIMAYADSNGVWFLRGAMRLNKASGSGARTNATVTFTGNYPVTFSGDQAAPAFASSTGIACTAQAVNGSATILIYHESSDEAGYHLNLDCALAAEPTWAAANMEGVVAADVYIPPASATVDGIVNRSAQTFAGVKTFSDGVSFDITDLSNAQATAMGFKPYSIGGTYAGGVTIGCTGLVTIVSSYLIPYQMQDGSWRMKFNIRGTQDSAQTTSIAIGNVLYSYDQAISSHTGVAMTDAIVYAAGGIILLASASNYTVVAVSGDVALTEKPAWAY